VAYYEAVPAESFICLDALVPSTTREARGKPMHVEQTIGAF
jgi:hypothetical protein